MANVAIIRVLAGFILQTFTLCLSQAEVPDEECLLQNHVRSSANAIELQKEFAVYVQTHGRQYEAGTEEFTKRYELFTKRFQHVQEQNQRKDALWTATLNTYTDRTEEELAQLRGWRGYTKSAGHVAPTLPKPSFAQNDFVIPEEINYSNLNALRTNFDQGSCGSCWAFAAAVTLQANAENACHNRTFSAQEIVSCVANPHHCGGTGGCHGATVELAMQYVLDNGLATSEELPYTSGVTAADLAMKYLADVVDHGSAAKKRALKKSEGASCKKATSFLEESNSRSMQYINDVTVEGLHLPASGNRFGAVFGLVGWERLPENRYKPLLFAVTQHGPVAVSVAASGWYLYHGGIFNSCDKDAEVNHAVTLTGFGKDGNNKYWTIKNSWGNYWGESGTIRLLRTDNDETDQCGTDYKPEMGTACDGGPKQVKVCGMCGVLYDSVVPHFEKACK